MLKKTASILFLALSAFFVNAQSPNTLTAQEKKEGWKLLFNGKDVSGWHSYGAKGIGSAWIVEQGALKLNVPNRAGNKAPNGGDIVSEEPITGDFEFKADWKVSPLANSGIFFFIKEAPQNKNMHDTGLEVQVLDNKIYEGAAENKHRAGDFFGVANARIREVNPVGEWNSVIFSVRKNKLTVSMNGFVVQEHDLASADWKQRIAGSGLKNAPIAQGVYTGLLGLQDWGSTVWYRNLKIRKL
ncbi:3-keto-disaccharide hydrolase [Runella sp.]|uniref:3-keto-disaccharide hydrolase n=1 Tax=Runella sp. TaxID=1960881 RepID=UPI003D148F0E